jgi:hypothetical protein
MPDRLPRYVISVASASLLESWSSCICSVSDYSSASDARLKLAAKLLMRATSRNTLSQQLPSLETVQVQVQYQGKGDFTTLLATVWHGALAFFPMTPIGHNEPVSGQFRQSDLRGHKQPWPDKSGSYSASAQVHVVVRTASVLRCTSSTPKHERKGHHYLLRVDLAESDSRDESKYVLSFQSVAQLEEWQEVLSVYSGLSQDDATLMISTLHGQCLRKMIPCMVRTVPSALSRSQDNESCVSSVSSA